MRRWVFSLVLLGLLATALHAQSIVFITRHGEKASTGGNDPDLSDAGRARAETLVKILKDADITMIFATKFKRTQETAVPLAKALRLNVTKVDAKDVAALVLKLRELKGNAVVVGHGDTIPNLIAALGIDSPVKIEDNDYDNLFVIVLGEKPRLLRLHYGF